VKALSPRGRNGSSTLKEPWGKGTMKKRSSRRLTKERVHLASTGERLETEGGANKKKKDTTDGNALAPFEGPVASSEGKKA